MPFLPPNQQRQSTEGIKLNVNERFLVELLVIIILQKKQLSKLKIFTKTLVHLQCRAGISCQR